jgi:predicted CXXCH cytochrome family protein
MPLDAPVISARGLLNNQTIAVSILPNKLADKMSVRLVRLLCTLLLTLQLVFGQGASGQGSPGPVQPIPFSHKTHVDEVRLTCGDCHVSPAKFGDAISIPDAPKCLECHAYSVNETTTRNTLNALVAKNQAIPWLRVFRLRDFVFFDHRYHLMNNVQCEDCHGPVGSEDVVSDRLKTTSMTFCQPCHVKTGALTGCNTCHDTR